MGELFWSPSLLSKIRFRKKVTGYTASMFIWYNLFNVYMICDISYVLFNFSIESNLGSKKSISEGLTNNLGYFSHILFNLSFLNNNKIFTACNDLKLGFTCPNFLIFFCLKSKQRFSVFHDLLFCIKIYIMRHFYVVVQKCF